jgi:hypothetical protein
MRSIPEDLRFRAFFALESALATGVCKNRACKKIVQRFCYNSVMAQS